MPVGQIGKVAIAHSEDYLQTKAFAAELLRRNYRLLIGEVRNEEMLYSTYKLQQPWEADARPSEAPTITRRS